MFQSLIAQLLKNPPAMQETVVRFLGWEDPMEMGGLPLQYSWASLMAQLVKNLPAMQETWVRSQSWEDPLEEGIATPHPQYFCLENPMDRGAWRGTVHGVTKSQTRLSD